MEVVPPPAVAAAGMQLQHPDVDDVYLQATPPCTQGVPQPVSPLVTPRHSQGRGSKRARGPASGKAGASSAKRAARESDADIAQQSIGAEKHDANGGSFEPSAAGAWAVLGQAQQASATAAELEQAAAMIGAPTVPAIELAERTARVAPHTGILWRLRFGTDLKSFVVALKRLRDLLNDGNAKGNAHAEFIISSGQTRVEGDGVTHTIAGMSVNSVLMGALMVAMRHETSEAWVQHPTGEESVRLCVRDLYNALHTREEESVEMWQAEAGGRVVVAAINTADPRCAIAYTTLPTIAEDATANVKSVPVDGHLTAHVEYHLYIDASNLGRVLGSIQDSKDLDVALSIADAVRGDGLILRATYGRQSEGDVQGGYTVPLRAVAPKAVGPLGAASASGKAPDAPGNWGVVDLVPGSRTASATPFSDDVGSADVATTTSMTAADAMAPGPEDVSFAGMRSLTLDEMIAAKERMRMYFAHSRLLRMLPSSGAVNLRFTQEAIVVTFATPFTHFLCMLASKTVDLDEDM